jgi:hypothetical protein
VLSVDTAPPAEAIAALESAGPIRAVRVIRW